MRVIVVVLQLLCYLVAADGEEVGGLQLHISETGLNKVIKYLLDYLLVPYLQEIDVGDVSIPDLGTLTVLINKVQFVSLNGEHAHITVKNENLIEISVGIQELVLAANVTMDYTSDEDEYGPDTVLKFSAVKLDVTASLGTSNSSASVGLQNCEAQIGDIDAEGSLSGYIKAVVAVAGGNIGDLVEKICPYLKENADEYLKNILDFQDTIKVKLPDGEAPIHIQTTSVKTKDDNIQVTTAVTFSGNVTYDSDDVNFPENSAPSLNRDLEIWTNERLINDLLHKGIDTSAVFLAAELTQEDGVPDDINTQLSGLYEDASLTPQGISLKGSSNVTFYKQSGQSKLFQTSFASVVPMTLASSETQLLVTPDSNLTQMHFNVTSENSDSISTSEMKLLQWNILTSYRDKISMLLKDYSVNMSLPRTDLYGLEDTLLKTSKGLLSISANLGVGASTPNPHMTVQANQEFSGKKLEVTFLDGKTRTFGKTNDTSAARNNISHIILLVSVLYLMYMFIDAY